MRLSQLKTIIKECIEESISEVVPQLTSSDPVTGAIKKLKQSYDKYPSFIPDVITYMKSPDDESMFVVVAKQSPTKQYVRLSVALPEEEAKRAAADIKKFHIQQLERGVVKGGQYALDPHLSQNAANALKTLKSGEPSGDTSRFYKTSLKEMHYFPDLNVQYYAGENLKVSDLSKKYEIFYRHTGGFYIQGYAKDTDAFDHHAYIIRNGIGTLNQADRNVYTKPELNPKDRQDIEEWSKKPEVQKRREFEKKNFPFKRFP